MMKIESRKDYCGGEARDSRDVLLCSIQSLLTFNGVIGVVRGLWMKCPNTGAVLLSGNAPAASKKHIVDSSNLVVVDYELVKTTLVIED